MARWPEELRLAVRLAMESPTPFAIWAGPEFTLVHNDAYAVVLAGKSRPTSGPRRARCGATP